MIVIRIFNGIRTHFSTRIVEWALAVIMINWGIRLLTIDNVLQIFPSFVNMANVMSENTWGWYVLIVGIVRFIALMINGTFYDTIYSRFSPHVRGVCAGFSAFFWVQIVISMISVIPLSPGMAVYAVFILIEIYCVMVSLNEAGKQILSGN